MKRTVFLAALTLAVTLGNAQSQVPSLPPASPAIDAIMQAFQMHPIVGMFNGEGGDDHDLAQQEDFYAAVVRDPRFAREVGNIVVEFGASSAQSIVDRFVNGEDVPYTELRKVWSDTFGWTPPPVDLGYVNLFAQIRTTNLSLPQAQRIHVWLGEPPIDWASAKKLTDIQAPGVGKIEMRDRYAAALIEGQILSPGRKALVIYGSFHFLADPIMLAVSNQGIPTMGALVERDHPGAIFTVRTYEGFKSASCTSVFENEAKSLPVPAMLPIRDTRLDDAEFRHACLGTGIVAPPTVADDKKAEFVDHVASLKADALLYLGPVASLTGSPFLPDIYLDGAYLKEQIRRRQLSATNRKIGPSEFPTVEKNTASPDPFKP